MPRIFQIFKKSSDTGFGTTNTTVLVKPAPSFAQRVLGTIGVSLGQALGISQAPTRVVATQAPGAALTVDITGTIKPNVNPGESFGTIMSLQPVPTAPASQVITKVDLVGTYGASSATNTTVTGSAWTNTGNASGVKNGSLSSHNGAVTAQHSYLTFVFPAWVSKDALTVTAVKLRYYARQGGTVLDNGLLRFTHGSVATPSNPDAVGPVGGDRLGNVDYLTTPLEVDLYALGFTTFASLVDFQCRIRGNLAAGRPLVTQDVDAVELVVTANA